MSYDKNSIVSLNPIEHIRKRAGMYISDVGIQGLHNLAEEVINNSVDEFIAGNGNKITIEIQTVGNSHRLTVTDNGRSIPCGYRDDFGCDVLEALFTKTMTGGKFNTDVYQNSGGLNGVGLKAVNALSNVLVVTSFKNKKFTRIGFSKGSVTSRQTSTDEQYVNSGTIVSFIADDTIFEETKFDIDMFRERLFYLSNTLPGLELELKVDGNVDSVYKSDKALVKIQEKYKKDEIFHFEKSIKDLDLIIDYNKSSQSIFLPFTNTIHNYDLGSHVDAVLDALCNSLKKITGKSFSRSQVQQGIVASLSIFFQEPVFRGQSKSKVADNRIYKFVYSSIYDDVYKSLVANKEFVAYLVALVTQQEQVLQDLDIKKAINNVKQASRENKLPAKLSIVYNCKVDERELFLVEGDSAAGSVRQARNPKFQEVLPLRGKVINAFKTDTAHLLSNKEVIDIFLAVGAMENSNTPVRTKKVFILADSDNDGKHIAALILSMFSVVYPSFIEKFELAVVEAPLFSLVSGDIRMYGHSIAKLENEFKKKHKNKKYEIYRNKGLGEMNPEEMVNVVDPKTRKSVKVTFDPSSSPTGMQKLMGMMGDVRTEILNNISDEDKVEEDDN